MPTSKLDLVRSELLKKSNAIERPARALDRRPLLAIARSRIPSSVSRECSPVWMKCFVVTAVAVICHLRHVARPTPSLTLGLPLHGPNATVAERHEGVGLHHPNTSPKAARNSSASGCRSTSGGSRRKHVRVVRGPHDDAALEQRRLQLGRGPRGPYAEQEPEPAHLLDALHRDQARAQQLADLGDVRKQPFALDHLERRKHRRHRHRAAAVGRAELAVLDAVGDGLRDEHRRERDARRDALREADDVRHDAVASREEHSARAPDSGLDLVVDEVGPALGRHVAQRRVELGLAHPAARHGLNGLDDDGCGLVVDGRPQGGLVAERQDHDLVEVVGRLAAILLVAGHVRREQRPPVEAALEGDDLLRPVWRTAILSAFSLASAPEFANRTLVIPPGAYTYESSFSAASRRISSSTTFE
jgi:hypothetical protein